MVKDLKTGECFRADHLIEGWWSRRVKGGVIIVMVIMIVVMIIMIVVLMVIVLGDDKDASLIKASVKRFLALCLKAFEAISSRR